MEQPITRRRFVGLGMVGMAGAATLFAGRQALAAAEEPGRLKARPGKPTQPVQPGIRDLGLAQGRDGAVCVPPSYRAGKAMPLVMMMHGARGRTEGYLNFCHLAAERGIAVVEPDSRGRTWDFDLSGYGPDVAFLDRALTHMFDRLTIDPRHLALAGFSDGASYALSLGLANGDLFSHVLAFSPGFMQPPSRKGKPAVWVSHGTHDEVLPIEGSRQRIVPQLKAWGYDVHYREFEGGHEAPPELGREAFRWFVP